MKSPYDNQEVNRTRESNLAKRWSWELPCWALGHSSPNTSAEARPPDPPASSIVRWIKTQSIRCCKQKQESRRTIQIFEHSKRTGIRREREKEIHGLEATLPRFQTRCGRQWRGIISICQRLEDESLYGHDRLSKLQLRPFHFANGTRVVDNYKDAIIRRRLS